MQLSCFLAWPQLDLLPAPHWPSSLEQLRQWAGWLLRRQHHHCGSLQCSIAQPHLQLVVVMSYLALHSAQCVMCPGSNGLQWAMPLLTQQQVTVRNSVALLLLCSNHGQSFFAATECRHDLHGRPTLMPLWPAAREQPTRQRHHS